MVNAKRLVLSKYASSAKQPERFPSTEHAQRTVQSLLAKNLEADRSTGRRSLVRSVKEQEFSCLWEAAIIKTTPLEILYARLLQMGNAPHVQPVAVFFKIRLPSLLLEGSAFCALIIQAQIVTLGLPTVRRALHRLRPQGQPPVQSVCLLIISSPTALFVAKRELRVLLILNLEKKILSMATSVSPVAMLRMV